MLALGKSRSDSPKCILNFVPCRINHNGLVGISERYWLPKESEGASTSAFYDSEDPLTRVDGKPVSYIRGRKLHGRNVMVPERYGGVVLTSTEKDPSKETKCVGEELEGDGDGEELTVMREKARFDRVVVWGHQLVPDEKDDTHIRGLEEWIAFAEQVHSYSAYDARKTKEVSISLL